jgi:5-methylcytosine-specific restriction endonuclease McrA
MPMHLCPGCQTKIPDTVRRCEACSAERSAVTPVGRTHSSGYEEQLDRLRKSPRWQKVRARRLSLNPFCQRCKTAVGEIVDHIVPAWEAIRQCRESGRWPFDSMAGYFLLSNLQSLCRACHAVKTAEDKAHMGELKTNIVTLT